MSEQRTEEVKQYFQQVYSEILGRNVSKKDAWALFKATFQGVFRFILRYPDLEASFTGVGRFLIWKSVPVGRKAEAGYKVVPRPKYYPSTTIFKEVVNSLGVLPHESVQEVEDAIQAEVGEESPEEEIRVESLQGDAFDIEF